MATTKDKKNPTILLIIYGHEADVYVYPKEIRKKSVILICFQRVI